MTGLPELSLPTVPKVPPRPRVKYFPAVPKYTLCPLHSVNPFVHSTFLAVYMEAKGHPCPPGCNSFSVVITSADGLRENVTRASWGSGAS